MVWMGTSAWKRGPRTDLEHPASAGSGSVEEGDVLAEYRGEVQATKSVGLSVARPSPEALIQEGRHAGADPEVQELES